MNEGRHADPRSLAIPTKIANKINEIFQLFYSVGGSLKTFLHYLKLP